MDRLAGQPIHEGIARAKPIVKHHERRQIAELTRLAVVMLQRHHQILELSLVAETLAALVDGDGARHRQPAQPDREKRSRSPGDFRADKQRVVDRDPGHAGANRRAERQRIALVARPERIDPLRKPLEPPDQIRIAFVTARRQDDPLARDQRVAPGASHARHAPAVKDQALGLLSRHDRDPARPEHFLHELADQRFPACQHAVAHARLKFRLGPVTAIRKAAPADAVAPRHAGRVVHALPDAIGVGAEFGPANRLGFDHPTPITAAVRTGWIEVIRQPEGELQPDAGLKQRIQDPRALPDIGFQVCRILLATTNVARVLKRAAQVVRQVRGRSEAIAGDPERAKRIGRASPQQVIFLDETDGLAHERACQRGRATGAARTENHKIKRCAGRHCRHAPWKFPC